MRYVIYEYVKTYANLKEKTFKNSKFIEGNDQEINDHIKELAKKHDVVLKSVNIIDKKLCVICKQPASFKNAGCNDWFCSKHK